MSKFRAWLQLIRVASLPTALADVWLGIAIVGGIPNRSTLWLSLVSLALYAAGMILNDVHDVEEDKLHNSRRPLASGTISVRAAAVAGFTLLVVGVCMAAVLGGNAGLVAAVLAALIVSYNFLLKATPFGPLNMGLCRAANVMLGAAYAPAVPLCWLLSKSVAAGPILIYVIGVTYLSRSEARGSARSRFFVPAACIVVAAALIPFTMLAEMVHRFPAIFAEAAGLATLAEILFAGLLVCGAVAFFFVRALLRARDVRRTVTMALIGIIPLEALVAAAYVDFYALLAAACIILLLIPVFALRKLSHIT